MKKALLFAGRVTAGYLLVGVLWALFSENLLSVLFREKEVFEQFYQNRDWFYVFTAAILLFLLIGYYFIAIQSATKRYQDFFNDYPNRFFTEGHWMGKYWMLTGRFLIFSGTLMKRHS